VAHQVVRARPVKVTPVAVQAQELMQAQAVVVVQVQRAAAVLRTKVVTAARVLHLQLPARQLPVRAVVAGMIPTARRAQAVRAVAVKAHNTLRGLALLAVRLTPEVVVAAVMLQGVLRAAVGQAFLLFATLAPNA
jgi:hypothetical protein